MCAPGYPGIIEGGGGGGGGGSGMCVKEGNADVDVVIVEVIDDLADRAGGSGGGGGTKGTAGAPKAALTSAPLSAIFMSSSAVSSRAS